MWKGRGERERERTHTGGGMAQLPNLSALDGALVAPTGGTAGRRRWRRFESRAEKTIGQFFEEHTQWDAKEHAWGEWWMPSYIKQLENGSEIDQAHHFAYRMAMGSSEKYEYQWCNYKLVYASKSLQAEVEDEGDNHKLIVTRKVKTISKLDQCEGGSAFYLTKEKGVDTVHFELVVGADRAVKSMRHYFQGGNDVGFKTLTATFYVLPRF